MGCSAVAGIVQRELFTFVIRMHRRWIDLLMILERILVTEKYSFYHPVRRRIDPWRLYDNRMHAAISSHGKIAFMIL